MPRHRAAADDFEDDPDDREAPDPSDQDADGDDLGDTVDCPRCGREISEYAEQCPRCGAYLSEEEATRTSFPRWVILTAAALVVATLLGWLGGVFLF
jgi:uncharacterized protein (DUF983 family)